MKIADHRARLTVAIDVSTVLMPLLNAMARHQGAEQGIGARALAEELGMSARRLRHLITLAREEGHAICGHPTSGYYMPTTPEELLTSLGWTVVAPMGVGS